METVKKARVRKVPYGTRVPVTLPNGNTPTSDVIKRRRAESRWDVAWFNFFENKWEREGERLTYDRAYSRAHNKGRANPYAKIGVMLLTGATPKSSANGSTAPKAKVDS